ncbi:P2X purinoceptor 7-like isoform X2 [Haliotis rubra]|uniref:P2X purinoceptor 7-like isoform X2 n=1 Tax=Haliotis rubra TaxID=36100 RepID=UPI001EE5607D|nr:P2X purinoceptor 7-like isoform X2 [Haliotis rubra]
MDGDINHTPPQHNPTKKRKRKTADGSRVRRRLNVDQVPVEADSTDDLEAASTTCINDLEAAPTTNTSSSSCPPKGPSAHHKAVKGAFDDFRLGYRPCDDPPRQPQPDNTPSWCRCGNCRSMPTAQEEKCCWQTGSYECVVDGPNFYTVISPAVLDIAMAHYNDFFVHDQERSNAAYRHQAYRQFILQRYGRLGHGNRRVVPSCVVLAIRRRFPDPTGSYTGYKEA